MLRQPLAILFSHFFPSIRKETTLADNQHGYALQPKNQAANVYSGSRTATDYHQWAMASNRQSKPDLEGRESEERIIPTGAEIVRTTDVSVMYHTGYTGDDDSIPSVKNHLG